MSTQRPSKNLLDDQGFKEFIAAFGKVAKESEKLSLAEGRKLCSQFFLPSNTVYEPVKEIENVEVLGRHQNKIPVRVFIPDSSKALPVIVYFHRGGWVFGNIEEADPVCRKLANHLQCIVASVDYSLAPEYPFPRGLEDCYDATKWVAENTSRFGGDASNVMVCGESAGGNLATVVAMMARDNNGPALTAQILINPVITSSIVDAVYENSVDRYFITKESMEFFWSMYLQSSEDRKNPYASPDQATDLSRLPPALIVTAEYDPLHQEGEDYANKLRQSGVRVISKRFPEVIHSFIDLPVYEESQKIKWIEEIGTLLGSLNKHD